MFTGLVEDCGRVLDMKHEVDSARLQISTRLAAELAVGDSISVNGVCLTVTQIEKESFTSDVMVQTLRLTSLGQLKAEDSVNLERAARVDGRLGGHIVQGHVDGVAKVHTIEPGERWQRFVVEIPKTLTRYIVNQGSITLDGVSLTVGEIDDEFQLVTVWLIPETLSKTNLATKKKSDLVNVEVDVLAKYVERLISYREAEDK
jgi:riboflavin synthase